MSNGPANKYNDRLVVRVLSDAVDFGDMLAAKRHKVSDRAIRNWRARLSTDPVLMASFMKTRASLESGWQPQRVRALKAVLEKIEQIILTGEGYEHLKELNKSAQVLGELQVTSEAMNVDLPNSLESADVEASEERDAPGAEVSDADDRALN